MPMTSKNRVSLFKQTHNKIDDNLDESKDELLELQNNHPENCH